MKVLINIPHLSLPGGVSNHYKGLQPFWSFKVHYNEVGRRFGLPGFILLPFDYLKFSVLCLFGGFDIILLNPSLGKSAIKRDAIFLKLAKALGKSVQVFFHGWNPETAEAITKNPAGFVKSYNRADGFLVLATAFKNDLMQWGITKPIVLTTTKISDALLKGFDINSKKKEITNLLFLTRVEEYKGIFIAVKAYELIKAKYPRLKLTIAGDGSQLKAVKELVKTKAIDDVEFLGHVFNEKLVKAFTNSDLYILPSYSEGMPTSVLEAMAFGLPIISRPVGGLNDFFENEKMGYLIESLKPEDYSQAIIKLIENPKQCSVIAAHNHQYAKQNFMASKVASQLENTIANV